MDQTTVGQVKGDRNCTTNEMNYFVSIRMHRSTYRYICRLLWQNHFLKENYVVLVQYYSGLRIHRKAV